MIFGLCELRVDGGVLSSATLPGSRGMRQVRCNPGCRAEVQPSLTRALHSLRSVSRSRSHGSFPITLKNRYETDMGYYPHFRVKKTEVWRSDLPNTLLLLSGQIQDSNIDLLSPSSPHRHIYMQYIYIYIYIYIFLSHSPGEPGRLSG